MRKFLLTTFLALAPITFAPQHAAAQAAAPQPPSAQSPGAQPGKSAPPKMAPAGGMPSDKDIADAKSKGMVWTNPTTKVYHKDGEFYGKTKNGKFMTESQAKSAYYRPSPDAMKKSAPKTLTPAASQTKKSTDKKTAKADAKTKPAQP